MVDMKDQKLTEIRIEKEERGGSHTPWRSLSSRRRKWTQVCKAVFAFSVVVHLL